MLASIKKFFKWLSIILIPLLLFVIYTFFTLHWVYSSGERVGFVQKISEKGFICKTYEGEQVLVTVPGTQAEKFFFTAKNEAIYNKINETNGQRVRLLYKQHKWIPSSCFGDTEYFVYDVKVLKNQESNGIN
ncbi:MAG: hypothetical protein K0U18_06895 [Betaproteobacteria bacterium]|nr:hypothetical protein [Betaproteobacteria bacterium]MCH9849581.1 hypothetical protein [Betaproteobacteria bacterium]